MKYIYINIINKQKNKKQNKLKKILKEIIIMFDITPILKGIVGLIAMLITCYVVPILKSKYGNNKVLEAYNTLNAILAIADIAVEAVEQMNRGKKGISQKKLNDATEYAKEMLGKYNITYNDKELRAAIEQSVKKMNAAVVETPENAK